MGDSAEWLRKQRDALTSGISRVVDEFNGDLEKELNRRDQEKRDLQEHISALVTKNNQLTTENNLLRGQSTAVVQPHGLPSNCLSSTTKIYDARNEVLTKPRNEANGEEDRTISYRDFTNLIEKYNALRSQNYETEKALREMQRRYEVIKEKCQATKERVKEWQRYTERQLAKKVALNSKTTTTLNLSPAIKATEDEISSTSASTTPRASSNDGLLFRSVSPLLPILGNLPSPRIPLNAEERLQPLSDVPTDFILANPPHNLRASALQEMEDAASRYGGLDRPDLPNLQNHKCRKLHSDLQANNDYSDIGQGTSGAFGGPSASEMLRSSQTTEDETALAQEVVKASRTVLTDKDDEDEPEFVSARSLKRKRQHPSKIEIYDESRVSDATSTGPIRIKEEFPSSPPQPVYAPQKLVRKETIDLDELGSKIATPRKRRLRLEDYLSLHSTVLDGSRREPSTNIPIAKGEALAENDLHIGADEYPPLLVFSDRDPDIKMEVRANSEPASSQRVLPQTSPVDALHTLDPNVRALPRISGPDPRNLRRQKNEMQSGQRIHVLGEDGEDRPPAEKSNTPNFRTKRSTPIAKAESTRRLRSLLEAPTPEKHTLSTTRTPITSKTRRQQHNGPDTPLASAQPNQIQAQPEPDSKQSLKHRRQGSSSRTGSRPGSRPGSNPGSNFGSRPGSRSSHLRLRARPLDQLTIADFKPNPAFNQGLNYVFSETVRGRDARRCLPGCTDPSCCGSAFRALAAAAPALPDESDESEQLLKNYLGDAYDVQRIRCMETEEREELVLQAKTRLMADKHGRHRHAYERRATPPGFWRTDMPTTQEIERDREVAKELEKKNVEERWRESTREGGRWLFRDE
ncbi:SAE2-domain-containing protein [Glonium stellatum]|uniref:SAE2-domain-containing protein n=1 Tax=Glonium stellatum TaxID=574774 RepID=A0A8E2ER28_9PEZI|nr:SAE2-domain-containing protein [Glonium stellatum]